MAAVWPLGDTYIAGTPRIGFADNVFRTPVSQGVGKARRRSKVASHTLQIGKVLTFSEVATFRVFFDTTLAYGTLDFTMCNPETGQTALFRFAEPPSIGEATPGMYELSMSLEVLP